MKAVSAIVILLALSFSPTAFAQSVSSAQCFYDDQGNIIDCVFVGDGSASGGQVSASAGE